jgi:hypothetical protein
MASTAGSKENRLTDFKLGRIKSPEDRRDLRASSYFQAVPDPPVRVNWSARMNYWSMALNDRLGCCTISAQAHQIQLWTLNTVHKKAPITNPAILKRYEEVSGYVPGDPSTDNGANMRDVLKLWLKEPLMTHTLTAFAAVDIPQQLSVTQMKHWKQALDCFGGIYLGLDLPLTAQTQIENGNPWDVIAGSPDAARGGWGGHCVVANSYSDEGVEVITWGRRQLMTWAFLATYGDEAYGLISSQDWVHAGKSPSGFDLFQLMADLQALRSR